MNRSSLGRTISDTFRRARFALSNTQRDAFVAYTELLTRWTEHVNLTAVREPDEIVRVHYLDSALLLAHVGIASGERIADVGSGAGFPGIPIAILRPDVRVVLFESVGKKAAFLDTVAARLGLRNIAVRAEHLDPKRIAPEWKGTFNGVVSRYTAPLPWLVECARSLVCPDGWLAAYKFENADEYANFEELRHRDEIAEATWIVEERAVPRRRFVVLRFALESDDDVVR